MTKTLDNDNAVLVSAEAEETAAAENEARVMEEARNAASGLSHEELVERVAELELRVYQLNGQLREESDRKARNQESQRKGIERARKKGVKFGRPQLSKPERFYDVLTLYNEHQLSCRASAAILDVSINTFRKWAAEAAEEAGSEGAAGEAEGAGKDDNE